MLALTLSDGRVEVADLPDPAPEPGMAVVRVALTGICRTDLELVKGYMGFEGVLGHEFVGRVEHGPPEWRGRRVVGEINFACGECEECERGRGRHCPARRVLGIQDADGALAERVALPVRNLHAVPDGVPDEAAAFTEPLAAAFQILEQVETSRGQRCLVLGDGKLGLLIAQALDAAGLRVTAVGRHPAKLAILRDRGIETVVARDLGDERWDLVVEATGREEGFRRALALTRPRGTLVLKTTLADSGSVPLAPIVIDEIRVVGSRCGPFPRALAALEAGEVDVQSLVTDTLPLARADQALRRAAEPGALKVLVDCSAGRPLTPR